MSKCFLYGAGTSLKGTIIVLADPGCTVTCSKGTVTKTAAGNNGVWAFPVSMGTWKVTATLDGETKTETVVLDAPRRVEIMLSFSLIPAFTYTGRFELVDDNDQAITSGTDDWKIRFLSSGTLTFTDLNGAASGIDVFLVGGGGGGYHGAYSSESLGNGGGGGGGGYTTTTPNVSVAAGVAYEIVVGNGGSQGKDGEASTAFGCSANGGSGGDGHGGGSGGSGGGGGGYSSYVGGNGGSDGEDGTGKSKGTGQGTTTREFGETTGKLYSGGGGGGGSKTNPQYYGKGGSGGGGKAKESGSGTAGTANTGGGGGGGAYSNYNGGSGGSGIVIIRNKR